MDLFTDRHSLVRAFTKALHEDEALGKILFLSGGGTDGTSLLSGCLPNHACKRLHDWDRLSEPPDDEFVRRLETERRFDPLPVARLDFHAPPREFRRPTAGYDALLMLRRQLGAFRARGFGRPRFPVFDFAAVWHLHLTGNLTGHRLRSLFPAYEISFVTDLANAVTRLPFSGVSHAVLGLFDTHQRERWTLFRERCGVDRDLIEELKEMGPEDLVVEMAELFALELKAALAAEDAPARIVLLFDGHDAFTTEGEAASSTPWGERDRWLLHLLAALDLEGDVVPVVAGRRAPRWVEREECAIPADYLQRRLAGHFSDADADAYLRKALVPTGAGAPALRARLLDYARTAPDEIHPLYAGLGADVVLLAARRGRRLAAEDFPEAPEDGKRPRFLVERLLRWAGRNLEYAIRSLAAARAFDRALFEKLSQQERNQYTADDATFDAPTGFSFVWTAAEEGRGSGWHSIHPLIRRVLRERGDERIREADAALEEIHRHRAGDHTQPGWEGNPLALAEAIYHAYRRDPERGAGEWLAAFGWAGVWVEAVSLDEAEKQVRRELCDALLEVGTEFDPEEPRLRARIAHKKGNYLLKVSGYDEADRALQASVAAYDEALGRAADDLELHRNKSSALESRGELLSRSSRHEEADRAFGEAVAACEEALRRAPDDIEAHKSKVWTLFTWGRHAQVARFAGHDGVARARWKIAEAHAERILALKPRDYFAGSLLRDLRGRLDDLDADSPPGG